MMEAAPHKVSHAKDRRSRIPKLRERRNLEQEATLWHLVGIWGVQGNFAWPFSKNLQLRS